MPVAYPTAFVERVKIEYAGRQEVCDSVERGDYSLGRYLAHSIELSLSPSQIIEAHRIGKPELVLVAAETAVRRQQLHAEWIKIMSDKIASLDTRPRVQLRRVAT